MDKVLDKISGPGDLKQLSAEQLKLLADEIRRLMIETVSRTGGHLASSLGVVELTVALHRVFDFKKDKLLFDVGHQCYPHKIITGRKNQFHQLRQTGGISGFPDPSESRFDPFFVGHAGSAVPTAIGIALGQQQQNRNDRIVALVGDASIVNGLSFEGLNNLGLVRRQLLIVLNDNSMAIDSTPGALARYFSRIRLSQTYEDLRRTTKSILEHMPVIGRTVEEAIERIKKSIRMVLPASQMFESLNIPYFGPVDGHDIESLIQLFEALLNLHHPAILHVYTQKGKGFTPAEKNGPKFHSTGPFTIDSNGDAIEPPLSTPRRSFTEAFGEHLVEMARNDDRIVAITSAMGDGTGLGLFRKSFPKRFYDVGIAESAAVDIAAGLAEEGLKPFVCIYSTFLQRTFDQIFQEVALQNLPVVFCLDRAGLVGADGPTHHGLMDIGFLRMMPNMVLTAPTDENELNLALRFALAEQKPVVIRYPKEPVPSDEFDRSACAKPFELGRSVVVRTVPDSPVAIVAYGSVLTEALEAASRLEKEGVQADVVNARFAAPVDREIIELVRADKIVITAEDHNLACGFGSAVMEKAAHASSGIIQKPIKALGVPPRFIKHGLRHAQLMEAGVNADKIVETAKQMLRHETKGDSRET